MLLFLILLQTKKTFSYLQMGVRSHCQYKSAFFQYTFEIIDESIFDYLQLNPLTLKQLLLWWAVDSDALWTTLRSVAAG